VLERAVLIEPSESSPHLELAACSVDDDAAGALTEARNVEQPASKVTECHEESPSPSANALG
jgi:hypothetical protein